MLSIYKCYEMYLQVEKVELPFDKQKDQRRGFVFVEFDSEKAVEKVLNETAHKMGSQEVCWILCCHKIAPNNAVDSQMMQYF